MLHRPSHLRQPKMFSRSLKGPFRISRTLFYPHSNSLVCIILPCKVFINLPALSLWLTPLINSNHHFLRLERTSVMMRHFCGFLMWQHKLSFGSISFMFCNKKFSHTSWIILFCGDFFWLAKAQRRPLHKWSIVSRMWSKIILEWIFWLWGISSEPPTDLQNGFKWNQGTNAALTILTLRFFIYFTVLENGLKLSYLHFELQNT